MADDASSQSFREELGRRELKFSERKVGDCAAFIVEEFPIRDGRNAGRILPIGFVLPRDYPSAAPAGVHYKWRGDLGNAPSNPQGSELGDGWQRMSRVVQSWTPGRRTACHYLAQVDRWLELL